MVNNLQQYNKNDFCFLTTNLKYLSNISKKTPSLFLRIFLYFVVVKKQRIFYKNSYPQK